VYNLISSGLHWIFFLVVFTLPFHWQYNNIAILLMIVACIAQEGFAFRLKNTLRKPLFWGLTAVFWTDALACLYSENLDEALFTLEKRLSIVLMPLLISSLPISVLNQEKMNKILQAFVVGVSVALLLCWVDAIVQQSAIGWKNINTELFMYHRFTNIIGVHSIYIAQYTAFSLGIIWHLTMSAETTQKTKTINVFLATFLYVSLFLLANRITILAFHAIVVGYGIYLSIKKPKFLSTIAVVFFLMMMAFYAVYTSNSFFRERAQEVVVSLSASGQAHGNTGTRLNILKCSRDILLTNQNWIWGLGTGDTQHQLNACYNQYAWGIHLTNKGKYDGPNAHNQYLQETLNKGIVGLAAWLALLFIPLIKMYQHQKNMLFVYWVFWGCFAMLALAESPLNMNKGVVYFSFFQSLFIFYSLSSSKDKSSKESFFNI